MSQPPRPPYQPPQPPQYVTWGQQQPAQPAPQYQQPPHPIPAPPRKRPRWPFAVGAIVAALIVAAAVGGSGDDDQAATKTAPKAPAYKVINEDTGGKQGRADLLMPKATPEQAEAAIRDYAKRIDGPRAFEIGTVRSRDAAVIVCRGEWRADDDAAQIYGGKAGLAVTCPDPKPL
jgi:hypothetical protein